MKTSTINLAAALTSAVFALTAAALLVAVGTAPVHAQPFAANAIPVQGASGNKANASAVATLPAVANRITYIAGFQCTASGATAGLPVNATVTDGTWTFTYSFTFPAGVLVGATPLQVTFSPPFPATATNTAITVTLPASGSGGTNAACNAQGFQL